MTLDAAQCRAVAMEHESARVNVVPIRRASLRHPAMTIDDAYSVQTEWVAIQVANGARVTGHKIGLTSRAMQQSMNIDEPDYGTLLDYMMLESGAVLRAGDYIDPRIEVELAFVLAERLSGESVTAEDVLDATECIVPALELIDARSYRTDPDDGTTRGVRDTIADNAANAGVVMGSARVKPDDLDRRWVGAIMKRNGIVEETGVAAAVLDDPVTGVVWLTRRLAGHGVALEAGEVVLSGSFTRAVPCRPGDVFEVDYRDLGVVTCRFE